MTQLPFIPEHVYNRRADIHALYGGNWQSGIAPSASYPYIFIFSGHSGKQHGYQDGWDNPNVFAYTGEGQIGDMEFTKGNLALRDHRQNGKRVFLFESSNQRKGFVKFICEVELFDIEPFETLDTLKNNRIGIKFLFKKLSAYITELLQQNISPSLTHDLQFIYEQETPNITERKGLVTSRVGQGLYRKRVIHRWEYECAVTGFDNLDVLIASHILPWSESTNEQRIDVHNGILLSPTYDALFDRHFISFENSGKIILSDRIEPSAFEKIGVTGKETIQKGFKDENLIYLGQHRTTFETKLSSPL